MKIGVRDFPPMTFRTLSIIGALAAIWLAARMQGISMAIPKGQLPSVIRLAIPNVLIWHVCVIYGVKMLTSGRAAILGYTMPIWAVLCGLIFFGERITRMAWLGIGLALAGALLLLSSEFSTIAGHPLGSLLILTGAASWGYGTVALKRSLLQMPTISLTFWMMALSGVVMAAAAILFERDAWRSPTASEWAAIGYSSLIILAFSQIFWFALARTLPPVASSLSLMMIPVLGVFSGAWVLGETPHWQDYAAMVLILGAMSTVLLKRRMIVPT
jgi:drug/metabolite transporter (DMT)-like permease